MGILDISLGIFSLSLDMLNLSLVNLKLSVGIFKIPTAFSYFSDKDFCFFVKDKLC